MNRLKMKNLFKSLIDESGATSVAFTDNRINELLYEGAQSTQDLLEDSDEHLFEKELELIVLADTEIALLPPDTRKLKQLYIKNVKTVDTVRYVDTRELITIRSRGDCANVFSLRGLTLQFPVRGSDTTYIAVYTKHLDDLLDDIETWVEIPSFAQRLVVYEAVYIGLISENSDVLSFERLLSDIRSKVVRANENRVDTDSRGVLIESETSIYQ